MTNSGARPWWLLGGLAIGIAASGLPAGATAQVRDSFPGVTLGLVYETAYRPAVAIKPFTGRFGGTAVAPQVEAIIGRDLRNSDRFEVMDSLPASMLGEGIDYVLWDRLGADWLVSGQVEGAGEGGLLLVLELHNVVYTEVKEQGRFTLPDPSSDEFRMAVHRASDEIVRWATGDPGMAASRIAFSLTDSDGNKDLYLIDADGENLRRLTNYRDAGGGTAGTPSITLSPAWSPDGTRVAFTSYKQSGWPRIYELNLASGRERALPAAEGRSYFTPAYTMDGRLAYYVGGGGIYVYDIENGCCPVQLSGAARWDDLSPTFSPDGRWMAFNSNRFGTRVPQIMVMPADGGEVETISPYEVTGGGSYSAPAWAPVGDLVAFHGQIQGGRFQILVADMRDRGRRVRQLTSEGNNEDPTWAPDGRHLAFVGERSWGYGLFVVDVATGAIRTLVESRRVTVPAWSPALGPDR
jgi:TolB protein